MNIPTTSRMVALGAPALSVAVVVLCLGLPSLAKAVPPGPPESVPVEVINDASNAVPVTITESNEVPVSIMESLDSRVVLHFRFDSTDLCGSSLQSQGVAHLELPDRSVATVPFVVPADKALLITHFNWEVVAQPGDWSAGQISECRSRG